MKNIIVNFLKPCKYITVINLIASFMTVIIVILF